jgi:hypothetical protein
MTPTILTFALINPLGWLLFATGRVERSLKMAMVIAPVVIAGYVAGMPFGADGVALGYSVAMALLASPMIAWAIHGTVISSGDIMDALLPTFVSAAVAAAVSMAIVAMTGSSGALERLLIGGGVLALTYIGMLLFVMGQKGFYVDLVRDSRVALSGR